MVVKPKVVVFGLDGATFQLIRPLIAQGKMPNTARLLTDGTSATLKSTIHPITPSAWASMVTGLNPCKHGVFDFRRRKPSSYEMELVNGGMRAGRALWSILNEHGYKTGMLNIPLTYPPDRVNGFVVSGMDAPISGGSLTYPRHLQNRIQQRLGRYIVDFNTVARSEDEYLAKTLEMLGNRIECLQFLCDEYADLDLLFAVFVAPDRIQHAFWKYLDPSSSEFHAPKALEYRSASENVYATIDEAIGWALARFGDGTYYLLVSDHGFGPLYKDVYMNKWLSDLGLLKFKDDTPGEARRFPHDVSWNATKAYSFGYFGNINVNLAGREPDGVVPEGKEAEQVKELIIRELHELRDPESGAVMVDRVYRKEELYSGPYFFTAPDLLIIMRNYTYMTRDSYEHVTGGLVGPPMQLSPRIIPHTGSHNLDGIFVLRGEGVASGLRLPDLQITDVTPTVLYLLNVPLPTGMDGKPPMRALTGQCFGGRKPSLTASRPPSVSHPADPRFAASKIERLERAGRQQRQEIADLKSLVDGYRRGRFMRVMEKVHSLRSALSSPTAPERVQPPVTWNQSLPLPSKLVVEPFGGCNLRCPLCPTGQGRRERPLGPMKMELFSEVLRQCGDSLREIDLFNWGEPLLNPWLPDMIRAARQRDIYITVSTNLNFLPDAAELVASGLNRLIISCSGCTADTYAKYHVGGEFEKVMDNLTRILNHRDLNPDLKIAWRFLTSSYNEHQVPLLFEMCRDLRIEADVCEPRLDMREEVLKPVQQRMQRHAEWIPTRSQVYDVETSQQKCRWSTCRIPWTEACIDVDGSVMVCCSSYDRKYDLGNIMAAPFEETWNGPLYRAAREYLEAGTLTSRIRTLCHICKDGGFRDY